MSDPHDAAAYLSSLNTFGANQQPYGHSQSPHPFGTSTPGSGSPYSPGPNAAAINGHGMGMQASHQLNWSPQPPYAPQHGYTSNILSSAGTMGGISNPMAEFMSNVNQRMFETEERIKKMVAATLESFKAQQQIMQSMQDEIQKKIDECKALQMATQAAENDKKYSSRITKPKNGRTEQMTKIVHDIMRLLLGMPVDGPLTNITIPGANEDNAAGTKEANGVVIHVLDWTKGLEDENTARWIQAVIDTIQTNEKSKSDKEKLPDELVEAHNLRAAIVQYRNQMRLHWRAQYNPALKHAQIQKNANQASRNYRRDKATARRIAVPHLAKSLGKPDDVDAISALIHSDYMSDEFKSPELVGGKKPPPAVGAEWEESRLASGAKRETAGTPYRAQWFSSLLWALDQASIDQANTEHEDEPTWIQKKVNRWHSSRLANREPKDFKRRLTKTLVDTTWAEKNGFSIVRDTGITIIDIPYNLLAEVDANYLKGLVPTSDNANTSGGGPSITDQNGAASGGNHDAGVEDEDGDDEDEGALTPRTQAALLEEMDLDLEVS